MSRIIGGFGISHTPSMGMEYDKGMAQGFDPRLDRVPLFA